MIACLKYGYHRFGNASGLVFTCFLCCYAPGYHALLAASIPFICLCLLVVPVDVGDGLRCITAVCPECHCDACSTASSWLNACIVALLICSCMIFIVDDHVIPASITFHMFMRVSSSC